MSIFGHHNQISLLTSLVERGAGSHAYLFHGVAHVGKRMVADEIAAKMLKTAPETLQAHPDFFVVEQSAERTEGGRLRDISVEAIRPMIERVAFAPTGDKQVVILDNADALSVSAQNALLKTLEEPSVKTTMILIAEDISALLPTILSRVTPVAFGRVSEREIDEGLIALGVPIERRTEALAFADGRPGIVFRALNDADFLARMQGYQERVDAFIAAPIAERITQIANLLKERQDAPEVLDEWLAALTATLSRSLARHPDHAAMLNASLEAATALKKSANPALALEAIALA